MYEFKFPFEPPIEDLKMVVTTRNGTKCYIYDTFCKEPLSPEEKEEKDRRILEIYARSERKKQLRALQEAKEKEKGAVNS